MTDRWTAIICSRQDGCRSVRVPRTSLPIEWENRRHENECAYWAAHMDEFVSFLPGIRRRRGDQRTERLVGGVIGAIQATEGKLAAWQARKRLVDRWREAGRR